MAQPLDQPTVFGFLPRQHLDHVIGWVNTNRERLHARDCTALRPSAQCSCGLHMAMTDLYAARSALDEGQTHG